MSGTSNRTTRKYQRKMKAIAQDPPKEAETLEVAAVVTTGAMEIDAAEKAVKIETQIIALKRDVRAKMSISGCLKDRMNGDIGWNDCDGSYKRLMPPNTENCRYDPECDTLEIVVNGTKVVTVVGICQATPHVVSHVGQRPKRWTHRGNFVKLTGRSDKGGTDFNSARMSAVEDKPDGCSAQPVEVLGPGPDITSTRSAESGEDASVEEN